MKKRTTAILAALMLVLCCTVPALAADGYKYSYTYSYDYWEDLRESPDAYRVRRVISTADFSEIGGLKNPQGLYVRDHDVYICDTGNNRVIQIRLDGEAFELINVFTFVTGSAEDFETAKIYQEKAVAYEEAAANRAAAEKTLAELTGNEEESSAEETETTSENSSESAEPAEEEKATAEEIAAAELALQQAQEAEEQAYHEVNDAEERIRATGCRIWETNVWKNDGGNVTSSFNSPRDIAIDDEGYLFIADTNNHRVVKMDSDGNLILEFIKPADSNFDQKAEFLPRKLVADTVGRVYVLSQNVNKGIVKFEADGRFNGFIGANKVRVNLYDQMWKMIATKEQRARMESFVPTEYENIALDPDGFFYVVTKTFKENELRTGTADPVRRLNAVGDNILVQNGASWVIGDLEWAAGNTNLTNRGPSKFADVTVLQDDIYMVLDTTHNRVFGYDQQGNMLWAFGGVGNADGFFNRPAAIEHIGTDLLILDEGGAYGGSLTVMTPTEYGQLVYTAIHQYRTGDYTGSADTWTRVLSLNGNSDSAYIGIGRALLQQEKYEEAMQYFKAAVDDKNYSEAWRLRRMELVEQNIVPIFIVVAAILVLPPLWRRIKKIKWEVKMFRE